MSHESHYIFSGEFIPSPECPSENTWKNLQANSEIKPLNSEYKSNSLKNSVQPPIEESVPVYDSVFMLLILGCLYGLLTFKRLKKQRRLKI